ncbi:hypothetical protein [Paenibacillus lautus]|uniref:hypothetical protein n=1 Tax=Paenibacillus lautus TaxID=1401 RepID=UPI001C7E06BD|nr:hypothetical protein [Paenibacillus lautus]
MQFHGDDFELYETEMYGSTYYNLSIEGYLGFDTIDECINLYKAFYEKLNTYINEVRKEEVFHGWTKLYRTRAIEVCFNADCYWVFLDPYKSTELRDMSFYMDDVIRQLMEFRDFEISGI